MADKPTASSLVDMVYESGYQVGFEAAKPKWISMEERKPKNGQHVLTIDSIGKQEVCYYNEVKNAFGECAWLSYIYNITHWMPMPEPPKEEA